jgi:hypothetical protein
MQIPHTPLGPEPCVRRRQCRDAVRGDPVGEGLEGRAGGVEPRAALDEVEPQVLRDFVGVPTGQGPGAGEPLGADTDVAGDAGVRVGEVVAVLHGCVALGPGGGHGGPNTRHRRKFVGAAVWSGGYKEKAAEISWISAA